MRYRFTRFTREGEQQVCEKLGKEEVLAEVFLALEMLLSEEGEVVGLSVSREDEDAGNVTRGQV